MFSESSPNSNGIAFGIGPSKVSLQQKLEVDREVGLELSTSSSAARWSKCETREGRYLSCRDCSASVDQPLPGLTKFHKQTRHSSQPEAVMNEYHPPSINEHSFNCPHCNVFAHHHWHHVWCVYSLFGEVPGQSIDISAETRPELVSSSPSSAPTRQAKGMFIGKCQHCLQITVWIGDAMMYPDRGKAPRPNEDLSEDIRKDYEEAASICSKSPRGAAALLRLAMQKNVRRTWNIKQEPE